MTSRRLLITRRSFVVFSVIPLKGKLRPVRFLARGRLIPVVTVLTYISWRALSCRFTMPPPFISRQPAVWLGLTLPRGSDLQDTLVKEALVDDGKIWMDGTLVPWNEAKVYVLTHTLHYGVGVFEGIRCYACEDGRSAIFRLTEHNDRLFDSAHILGLKIPFSPEAMMQACIDTVRANQLKECYIRPIVFIGEGERGLHARSNPIRVAIAAWPWGAYLGEEGLKKGIRVKTSSFQRFHVNTLMTKAKAVGTYLNSILAGKEVWDLGYDEALLLDTDGYVAEGPGENIFIVRRGKVKTPPLSSSILPGITRDSVITLL